MSAWLVTRLGIVAVAVAASLIVGYRASARFDAVVPQAVELLGAWDTTWYLDILRNGYGEDPGVVGQIYTSFAFYPLYPILGWPLAAAGLNPFVALIAVSGAASVAAFAGFHRLTSARFGAASADHAIWVLALMPPALVLSLAYTEALSLALALPAAILALRNRFVLAGLLAGAATLTRPTGILVAVLVGHMALRTAGQGRLRRVAFTVIPPVVALGAFLTWMEVARGGWNLPFLAQNAWERGGPGVGVLADLETYVNRWDELVRDIGFCVLYLWLLRRLWRSEGGLRSPWVLYSALAVLLPLLTGSVFSLARFGVLAFPLIWPLSDWIREHPARRRPLVALAVAVTAAMIVQLSISSM